MTNANVGKPDEKFLFNIHVFDADIPKEVEETADDLPPPPPVFSLEELEAAKASAFAAGKAEAVKEERESRAQRLENIFSVISREMIKLFAAEDLREACFEFETVRLSDKILSHIFPLYASAYGFDELKDAIRKVIAIHNGTGAIRVSVHPEMIEGVEGFLKALSEQNPELRFSVKGEETLPPGGCKLTWEFGGAIRNTEAMALEIRQIIQDALAARGAKGHDEEENMQQEAAAGAPADEKGETP